MTITAYRDEICARGVVPSWLRRTVGGQLLYAIGLHIDLLREILVQGVKSRFPGFNRHFTPILCRDRGISRGPEESEDQIAARLIQWKQSGLRKGGWTALLRQLQGYCSPHAPRIRLVSNVGRYQEISPEGSVTVGDMQWNWDNNYWQNTRFWVLIWPPSTLWMSEGTWGDAGTIGDGGVIGSTAPLSTVIGFRGLVQEWSRAAARHVCTIVIWDDALWWAKQPDGTWWKQGNRNEFANYWPGEGFE